MSTPESPRPDRSVRPGVLRGPGHARQPVSALRDASREQSGVQAACAGRRRRGRVPAHPTPGCAARPARRASLGGPPERRRDPAQPRPAAEAAHRRRQHQHAGHGRAGSHARAGSRQQGVHAAASLALRPRIQAIADELLAEPTRAQRMELMTDLAGAAACDRDRGAARRTGQRPPEVPLLGLAHRLGRSAIACGEGAERVEARVRRAARLSARDHRAAPPRAARRP